MLFRSSYLLSGKLEETNDAYAIAKIAGIKMCQSYNEQYNTNYKCLMPTNTYGPNDNYDKTNSHFFPALIKKVHKLKSTKNKTITLWGNGTSKREVIHVDDLADACVYLMNNYDGSEIINIGTGKDITIKELAHTIKEVVGFEGDIYFNTDMPDGTPRKLLDVSRLRDLDWEYKTSLTEGIKMAYKDYVK